MADGPRHLPDDALDHLHLRRLLAEVAMFLRPTDIEVTPPVPAAVIVLLNQDIVGIGRYRSDLADFSRSRLLLLNCRIDNHQFVILGPIVVARRSSKIP